MKVAYIKELVEGVTECAQSNNFHGTYVACGLLLGELKKINIDYLPEGLRGGFVKCVGVVERWSKNITTANLYAWGSVADVLNESIDGYSESKESNDSYDFVVNLFGSDFAEVFGRNFILEIVSFYDDSKEGNVEMMRQVIASLWRYYEENRSEIDELDPGFKKYIGQIANRLNVRHGDEGQIGEKFIAAHGMHDYVRLLRNEVTTMLSAFVFLNCKRNIIRRLEGLHLDDLSRGQ